MNAVPTPQTLFAFAVVSALIMMSPGPSNVFVLAHGIGHGRRAALAAVAGISLASAIRVVLAAVGLSALLASSAVVFEVIRWAGVAYLAYLGVQAWRVRQAPEPEVAPVSRSVGRGLLVGLGNPKTLIFFLAFIPQFVHAGQGPEAWQILVLGTVFWVIGVVWDVALACASGTIGGWLRARPRLHAAQPRVEGVAYLCLAVWAAVTGTRAIR
ncbi:LysE family translocator [Lentzea sp. NPDC058450]|uniref:LysE family translocator n=1 Tax=Lentzea sp. NPDC058450 TaxID=3346505 RepID=UPI0036478592